jgi:hypothetical protein
LVPSQLGRIVLASSSLSADEHVASTDERGSYGELMDAIDHLLQDIEEEVRSTG